MLIALPSRLSSDAFFRSVSKAILLIVAFCTVGAAIGFHLFLSENSSEQAVQPLPALPRKHNKNYALIGSGPLSLDARSCSAFLSGVIEEIQIVGKNTRPDSKSKNSAFLIRLKQSNEEREVSIGQALYLNQVVDSEGTRLQFSAEPSDLGLQPSDLDQQPVIEIFHRKSGQMEESVQLLIEEGSGLREAMAERPYFAALQDSKWWGTDLFVQLYAGEMFKNLQGKQKLELASGSSSHVCFVSQGDYLTWNGEAWQNCTLDTASEKAPLAYVKALGQKGMEIQAWDEKGFSDFKVQLTLQPTTRSNAKIETALSLPRLRNTTQISCVLGKRRMILKKGDFVLKTAAGWHHVRTGQEMESCFKHRIKGDLFVFDGIEKEDGKMIAKGRFFDPMRTQFQTCSVPIAADKKKSNFHHKTSKRSR